MAAPAWRRHLRFWGPDPAADVDEEFAFHLAMRIDELVAQGRTPQAARDEALRGFGDLPQVRATCRRLAAEREHSLARSQWWADWRHDVRIAFRQLRANPLLTGVLVVTIALGIGATVASFGVLHAVLLRPLPFADSGRIVRVYETFRQARRGSASVGHFHDWTEQATVFERTAAMQGGATYNLADGEPERLVGLRVTPGFFEVAAIAPALGRYFTDADLAQGQTRVAVIGHGLWRRRFGADPAIVGRTLALNGEPHVIVGIAAAGHSMGRPGAAEIYTPLVFTPEQRANYGSHSYAVLAKLNAGVALPAARADLERVTRGIAEREPAQMADRGVNVEPFDEVLLGEFRRPLWVLLASVMFVLLIGCANVANLLLARATTRQREMAIRAAIGGGRWRIVRQLLTESLVLAAAGGALGVGLAALGVRTFAAFGPAQLPRLQDAGLRPEVLLFALGLTLATGLVFGLAPAWRAAREDPLPALREGGRTATPGASRDRLRAVLVVTEIAVAVVLLVGAGLVIRSAWRLYQVPPGFDTTGVLTARVALPPEPYPTDAAVADAYRRMLDGVRAIAGVTGAGAATTIPMGGGQLNAGLRVEGRPLTPESMATPEIRLVTDGYVEAIGMRLVRGRSLGAEDAAPGAPRTVVINEQLARLVWPGTDPIGQRVSTWAHPDAPVWREVVGVVADVRSFGPANSPVAELFIPYAQAPESAWDAFQRSLVLVVRGDDDPAAFAPALRRTVRSVDPSLPLFAVNTLDEVVGQTRSAARFSAWLLALLAGIGLLLAAVGIYGVIAYYVTQRTVEIGVRLALGASPRSVLLMVVRHGAMLAGGGIVIGLAAALAMTRAVASLLFETTPTDPATYAAGAAGLFAVALLACALPALRAVRVSPMQSLAQS